MRLILATCVFLIFPGLFWAVPGEVQAQVTREWVKRYTTLWADDFIPHALALDNRRNILVTGQCKNVYFNEVRFLTIKYGPDGVKRWDSQWISPEDTERISRAVAVDNDNKIYVAGDSIGANGEGYVIGKLGWSKEFGHTVIWTGKFNGQDNTDHHLRSMALDPLGNACVTGYADLTEGRYCFVTIKWNTDGVRQWVRRYHGPGRDAKGRALAVDALGNVYVTGESSGSSSSLDYVIIKYTPDGAQAWVRRYNGPGHGDDLPVALALDSQGNVYVTGERRGADGKQEYATIKYSPAGQRLWVRRYKGPDAAAAIAMKVDGQDNIYVTGWSKSGPGASDPYGAVTIKYNSTGARQWTRRFGPAGMDARPRALAVDGSDNVYITGSISPSGDLDGQDYFTLKYSPDGVRLWRRDYNGPANGPDIPCGLAVDALDNVYVTGSSAGSGTPGAWDLDFATIKYSQTSP